MTKFILAKSPVLFAFLFFCALHSHAATIEDTLYINRGNMLAVDSTSIPYFAFNTSSTFNKENKRLIMNAGDIMMLTVINTDTVEHGFDIKGYPNMDTLISMQDTVSLTFTYQNPGAHIFYDPSFSEGYRYMGLAGMIVVKDPTSTASNFYWNMKEHQVAFNEALNQGSSVNWNNYYPDYFTINGKSNPHINNDTNARVIGSVGDTIHIYMVNTGQSLHSIHFHGYHLRIMSSTKFPNHVGRSKDTFPVYSMEAVVLELVPDQPGEYPVHDHNLVAVSGGNIYPNGMFLTLLID
ncbi:Multicopper oxidase [Lishizhenia tianjinensis]|uniref:Multicopper oxidase n=1 Tax=Lishizhenia tianjinensis TaxID=477690 RepID=A0A1I7AIA6_9FLAO|nr:multicopper oxidase domain-containing protein [Lishizhenia tianjinensis]SFT74689.1 Multicopper oxidase [Lishizhenia tianjinensis]